MRRVMDAVGLGRQLRTDFNVKVRQPLQSLHIVSRDSGVLADVRELEGILLDELNVKELLTGSDEQELVEVKAKLNFKRVGPRLGKKVKQAAGLLAGLPAGDLQRGLDAGGVDIELDGEKVTFTEEDLQLEREPKEGLAVAAQGDLVVALETGLTPALIEEGLAREFVNKVQSMRKSADFDVTQRISISYDSDEEVGQAVSAYGDYVQSETLALECSAGDSNENHQEWDLNGHSCKICIKKAS